MNNNKFGKRISNSGRSAAVTLLGWLLFLAAIVFIIAFLSNPDGGPGFRELLFFGSVFNRLFHKVKTGEELMTITTRKMKVPYHCRMGRTEYITRVFFVIIVFAVGVAAIAYLFT